MQRLFQTVVNQRCENSSCSLFHRLAGGHSISCPECKSQLAPVWGINRRTAGLAVAALVTVVLLSLLGVRWFLGRRAAEREAQLRLQPELTARLHAAYADGNVSPEERAAIDTFVRGNGLAPATVSSVEGEVARRVEAANRSLASGTSLMARRMATEARDEFRLATEADPDNSMAWAELAAAESILGHRSEAHKGLSRALQLDPGNWLAHYNLGLVAAREGDRAVAFHQFEQALAICEPSGPERRALVHELLTEPGLAEHRQDPRFEALLGSGGTHRSSAQGTTP